LNKKQEAISELN
jgi:hypothetical protein